MADSLFTCLAQGNQGHTQVGPLLNVEQFRKDFLFGIDQIADDLGNKLSDETLQTFLNIAVSTLEHDLDLAITPRQIQEHKDYYANDYYDWGYLQLNRYPVISVDKLEIVYLRNDTQLEDVLDIPQQWIRIDPPTGIVRLVPNNRFPARLQVDASGTFFPELFNRYSMVPNLWVATYTWGFKDGCVPTIINAAIGLIAGIYVLNSLADLNIGAGIAGTNLSLDGLSQGIQTTGSAENTTFSAKVKEYNRLLFGDKSLGSTGIFTILRNYYKGASINII